MPSCLRVVCLAVSLGVFGTNVMAQEVSTVPTRTPPISPNVQETPVPPRVQVPPPSAAPPAGVPTNRPLTADEAARLALALQPDVVIARLQILAAKGRTRQVRSGLLPTVSLGGSYNLVSTVAGGGSSAAPTSTGTSTGTGTGSGSGSGTGTGTGTGSGSGPTTVTPLGSTSSGQSTGFLFTATLKQLIFDFNHTRDLVRQSVALEVVAQHNLTIVQFNVVLNVKQAFYNLQQNTRLVAVNEANVANRQSQLELARARLLSGLGQPADVVTAETAVSEAVNNLNLARNNEDQARTDLAYLIGIDPRTPIVVAGAGETSFASNDVNTLVQTGLRQRPEVLQAQATIKANQYGLNAARTTNAPVISGTLGLTSRDTDFPPGNDFTSIGASITWSPFDGGLTSGRVQEARANLLTAQQQLLNTQRAVTLDISQAYFALRTAEQRVATANSEVANAQEGVRLAEGRYRSGLGLFLDIINAQAELLTAQTNQVQAQAVVDQQRAAINRAIGNGLPPTPAR